MKSCAKLFRPMDASAGLSALYKTARASRFAITPFQFEGWLGELAAANGHEALPFRDVVSFSRELYLHDLVLARACCLDVKAAWEELVTTHHAAMKRAAFRLAEEQRAGELAESLWTDLYLQRSKLASYSARGPLESWLKANLYQANTNLYRAERRFLTLEEGIAHLCPHLAARDFAQIEVESLIEQSLHFALQEVSAEERFLLAAYFLDGRNLLQISAVLNVHESTVSRRLTKLLKQLRRRVAQRLRARGLTGGFPTSLGTRFDLRQELL